MCEISVIITIIILICQKFGSVGPVQQEIKFLRLIADSLFFHFLAPVQLFLSKDQLTYYHLFKINKKYSLLKQAFLVIRSTGMTEWKK